MNIAQISRNFWVRILFTLCLLGWLAWMNSPQKILEVITTLPPQCLLAIVALLPVFLFLRVIKWYLLVRQYTQIAFINICIGYFWGMAIGAVTPARSGELARIWAAGLPSSYVGLFVQEKLVEIYGIVLLSMPALYMTEIMPGWPWIIISVVLVALFAFRRIILHRVVSYILSKVPRLGSRLAGLDLSRSRIALLLILSMACQAVLLFQVYIFLNSTGTLINLSALVNLPLVLWGNLIPFFFGGFGAREAIGVATLIPKGIDGASIISGLFFVSFVDLIIPALCGLCLRRRAEKHNNISDAPAT